MQPPGRTADGEKELHPRPACQLGHARKLNYQAFVVNQVNGTWRTAAEVPGIAALNTGGNASVSSVSCPTAGNCSAGGYYDVNSFPQAFVVSQN